jgi:PAS domain S-box-containing protein
MGIRSRIFILLLILFVPLLLLQSTAFYKWYLDSKETEMQANLELARSVAKNFETFLGGLLRGELGTGLAITASLPMADQDRDHMLESFQADNPAIRSIFWMNSDGLVIASSVRTYIGFDLKDRSFFQGVKEGKDWAVSELIVGRATGKPAFTVSRGIRNEKGDLLGVVAAAIEPDRLDPLLAVPRSKNAGISLIDSKGIHVYRYPPTNREYTPEQRNWLKSYPILGDALRGKEVVSAFRSKIRGEERLVAFVPIPSIGWVAACSRGEGEVIADILNTLLPQAVLILLVTLAAFGAAIWFSRPITSSIRRLQQHAAALGRGERERLEAAPDPREIKILAETFNDMAEKVRLRETALRESEAKYRDLFENMSEGFFLAEVSCDDTGSPVDYRYLDANIAFVQLTGLKRDEIIGRTVREVLPGVEDHWIKTYGRVALTRNPVIIDDFAGPLGRRYHTVAYSPRPGQFACLFQDITEHKRDEELARQRLREIEDLYRNAPVGLCVLDHDLRFLRMNERLAEINGIPAADHIGKTVRELMPQLADKVEPGMRHILATGEPKLNIEITGETPAQLGTQRTWMEQWLPIKDASGRVTGLNIVVEETTERKLMEEELRRSRDELELRVRERTAELERRNRELQNFAFIASHDLSEPLRKIQTFGDLLKVKTADRLGEQERDYVTRMSEAANRMQELLNALLRYSRIESQGRDHVPMKLDEVLQSVLADLEVSIQKIGAQVEIGSLPSIHGDPYQWRQLFQNLLANALKYYRSEVKPQVRIYSNESNAYCRIYVEDNGIGFDEKYLDKIFQPFQRLHGRNEYPGTGIGLAICSKIVERHGGNITAKSTPGKGSTFIVTLPVNPAK